MPDSSTTRSLATADSGRTLRATDGEDAERNGVKRRPEVAIDAFEHVSGLW